LPPSFIDSDSVREACAALQLTSPLPHQAVAIARMLDVFVYARLRVQVTVDQRQSLAKSGHATARLARALATEPAYGFLLTDGMGMGKTFQAIATAVLLLTCDFEHSASASASASAGQQQQRVLVVLNSALIATWCEQIARHWRQVDMKRDVFVYSGRDRLARLRASSARFVFSTYETLRADATALSAASDEQQQQQNSDGDVFGGVRWRLIIFDEVHKARNGRRLSGGGGSALWRTLRRFPATVPKLGLTGTPVCNHMMELCSIAQVVFKDHAVLASEDFWAGYERHFTRDVLALLRSSILLRRTLASEGIALPPRTDTDVAVALDADEKAAYRAAHERMECALADWIEANERHAPPFVVQQARDRYASCVNLLGLATCGESKLREVVRICTEAGVGAAGSGSGAGERVVIVSRFVRVLESLQTALSAPPLQLRTALFTGALDWRARGAVVDAFRARELDAVLLSTMAGNEGVDFSCCQHLVLVDSASAPNPMTHEDQVVARIYRIGQQKPSFIWRLIAVATIDDAFAFELHAQKRANAHALLDRDVDADKEADKEADADADQEAAEQPLFRSVVSTADLLRRAVQHLV